MTSMLHRFDSGDDFDLRSSCRSFAIVTSSTAAATSLAENYVGIERV